MVDQRKELSIDFILPAVFVISYLLKFSESFLPSALYLDFSAFLSCQKEGKKGKRGPLDNKERTESKPNSF